MRANPTQSIGSAHNKEILSFGLDLRLIETFVFFCRCGFLIASHSSAVQSMDYLLKLLYDLISSRVKFILQTKTEDVDQLLSRPP